MNGAPPPLKRIDHIVVLVRGLNVAFATYTERLGFPISWQVESKEGWRSSAVWLGNASLELLEPSAKGDGEAGAFFQGALDSRGEGPFLVAFEPPDIDYSAAPCGTGALKYPNRSRAPSSIRDVTTACVATAAPSSTVAAHPASTLSSASTTHRSHLSTEVKDP